MGKTVVKILAILSIIALQSCKSSKTPAEYLYHPNINRTIYQADRLYLKILCNVLLSKNIEPFDNKLLFDKNSILIIDTILYSPNADKLVVFVITQSDMDKEGIIKSDTTKSWFTGFQFYGYRINNKNIIINKYCNYSFSGNNKNELKDLFYSYALTRKQTDHPFEGQQQYNMNDIRLWSSKEIEFEFNDSINLIELIDDTLHFLKKLK